MLNIKNKRCGEKVEEKKESRMRRAKMKWSKIISRYFIRLFLFHLFYFVVIVIAGVVVVVGLFGWLV